VNIHIVTTAYNLPGATRTLVDSIMETMGDADQATIHLFQHSMFQEISETCADLELLYPRNVRLYSPLGRRYTQTREGQALAQDLGFGTNRGLARSWNDGIITAWADGADAVLVVNDDVKFGPAAIEALARKSVECDRRNHIITCCGWHEEFEKIDGIGYSCFAITKPGFALLGCFDENLFPIYWEDIEFGTRAEKMGMYQGTAGDLNLSHGGSTHLKTGLHKQKVHDRNKLTQTANEEYYLRKWGAPPDEKSKQYAVPFNDKRFGLYIHPHCAGRPYPGYDRIDRHLVTI
jgi:hypothetical protein